MAKPEWGTKRMCPSCGARYYDLGKEPVVCPSCGTVLDLKATKSSGSAAASKAKPKPEKEVKKKPRPAAAEPGEEGDLPEVADADIDDEVLEDDETLADADDLGEDGDLQEVIEDEATEEK